MNWIEMLLTEWVGIKCYTVSELDWNVTLWVTQDKVLHTEGVGVIVTESEKKWKKILVKM